MICKKKKKKKKKKKIEEEELIFLYIIDYCNSEVYFLFICEKLVTDFNLRVLLAVIARRI
jgi:hypothetical protein